VIEINESWIKSGNVGRVDLELKTLYEQIDAILERFAVNLEHQLRLDDKSMVSCVMVKAGIKRALMYLSERSDPELHKFLQSTNLDLQWYRWPFDKPGIDQQTTNNQ